MNQQERESRERLEMQQQSLPFRLYRPGGNDTCLVEGILQDGQERKMINDLIMAVYPQIEQVGFIDANPVSPSLMMAAGEFCGNATRATAQRILDGNAGVLEMQVSGANAPLVAGVNDKGEAFAQMPLSPDRSRIQRISPTETMVSLEGITQVVSRSDMSILSQDKQELKSLAFARLTQLGLTEKPASGIMYTIENGSETIVVPVVYVRDINTLFVETACGSGTIAIAATKAVDTGKSVVDMPIKQPSGEYIAASVTYDGKTFGYSQIAGAVSMYDIGKIEYAGNTPYVVRPIKNERQLMQAFDNGLVQTYQKAFEKAPYEEYFSPEQVQEIFGDYLNDGSITVAQNTEGIVGFEASVPLSAVPDIGPLLTASGIDPTAIYLADIGVDEKYRRQGVATRLMKDRFMQFADTPFVLRTSVNNFVALLMYRSLGFSEITGLRQSVQQIRTDGSVKNDERLFLKKG